MFEGMDLIFEEERESARTDPEWRTDAEILAEELRICGRMSDLAIGLLENKEDDWMRTWGRLYG